MPQQSRNQSERGRWGTSHAPHAAPARTDGPVPVPPPVPDGPDLTPRQRQVILLIAQGCKNQQIAGRLGISRKTVESHRTRIHHTLGDGDVATLTRLAIGWGWVQPIREVP